MCQVTLEEILEAARAAGLPELLPWQLRYLTHALNNQDPIPVMFPDGRKAEK